MLAPAGRDRRRWALLAAAAVVVILVPFLAIVIHRPAGTAWMPDLASLDVGIWLSGVPDGIPNDHEAAVAPDSSALVSPTAEPTPLPHSSTPLPHSSTPTATPTTSAVAPMGYLHPSDPEYLWIDPIRAGELELVRAWAVRQQREHLAALPPEELCRATFVAVSMPQRAWGNSISEVINGIALSFITGRHLILNSSYKHTRGTLRTSLPAYAEVRVLRQQNNCTAPLGTHRNMQYYDAPPEARSFCVDPRALNETFVYIRGIPFLSLEGLYSQTGVWPRLHADLQRTCPMCAALMADPATLGLAFLATFEPAPILRQLVARERTRLLAAVGDATERVSLHIRHRASPAKVDAATLRCIKQLLRERRGGAKGVFLSSELPESVDYFASELAAERNTEATASLFHFNFTEFSQLEPQWAANVSRECASTSWGQPGHDGWWGPAPTWTGLVDLFLLAAFRPTVFIGSHMSTFSEVALQLAFALTAPNASEAYVGGGCVPHATDTLDTAAYFRRYGWSSTTILRNDVQCDKPTAR